MKEKIKEAMFVFCSHTDFLKQKNKFAYFRVQLQEDWFSKPFLCFEKSPKWPL